MTQDSMTCTSRLLLVTSYEWMTSVRFIRHTVSLYSRTVQNVPVVYVSRVLLSNEYSTYSYCTLYHTVVQLYSTTLFGSNQYICMYISL